MQEKPVKPTKRIKQISVTGLFGMFNHVIPLNMDERITIIHGPNGFGKTAILKLLNALFHKDNGILRETVFNEFHVEFEDNTSLWMKKFLEQSQENVETERITFYATNKKPITLSSKFSLVWSQKDLFSEPPAPESTKEIWKHPLTEELFVREEVWEQLIDSLQVELYDGKELEWLTKIREAIPVRFIETQRLLNARKSIKRSEKQSMIPTVTMYSNEIANTIQLKLAESSALSQSLDKTFPARVFSPTATHYIMRNEELHRKLSELEEKRSRLTNVGLLDLDDSAAFQMEDDMDDSKKTMLSVYVEDTEKKLGVYDEIASKIDLLTQIINKRFLYKKMTTSKDKGFIFTTSHGVTLPLESLSSGEQHELVLFYELLFKTAPGSLVLIDEPEISLHVVWQEHFLKDVQEVTRLSDIDVIVATHSPDVINGHRDLLVELKGPK